MTKEREALKLALEALECALSDDRPYIVQCKEAITAIKEALAQPEQEPVVWMYQNKSTHEVRFQKHMRSFVDHGAWYEVPLYSEPLANQEKTSGSPIKQVLAQSEQEPKCVAIVEVFGKGWRLDYMSLPVGKHKLYAQQYTYTTPPQRKPLSDEEIILIVAECAASHQHTDIHFARAIEAKLKEKNQ